jgi:hypothetical protein
MIQYFYWFHPISKSELSGAISGILIKNPYKGNIHRLVMSKSQNDIIARRSMATLQFDCESAH